MKDLKLNKLAKNRLERNEMQNIAGGASEYYCTCGCNYANSGGSSVNANGNANADGGLMSARANGDCKLYMRSFDGMHYDMGWGTITKQ